MPRPKVVFGIKSKHYLLETKGGDIAINDEEKKALFKYLLVIQENTTKAVVDRQEHFDEDMEKYKDLMVAIGKLTTETSLLIETVKHETKQAKSDNKEAVKSVEEAAQTVEETMAGKTKIIEKQIVHRGPLHWLTKRFKKRDNQK